MPFEKTWSEELVAEWLQLKGYLVETGLPIVVFERGGRYEADVVGAKVYGGKLDIIHVEVGSLAGGRKDLERLKAKFSEEAQKSIESHFRQIIGFDGETKYRKIYVATFWTNPIQQGAEDIGIVLKPLPDFIQKEIIPTIENWKSTAPHHPKTKDKNRIMLPENCWLFQLIDYLNTKKLLKE